MLMSRNGQSPTVPLAATITPSAQIVGNVSIDAGSYVDYNVVIASAGLPIEIGEGVIIRSRRHFTSRCMQRTSQRANHR